MDCTSNADVRWHTPKQCSLFLLYIKLVFLVIVDCAQFQFWEATGRRFCCVHAVPTRRVDLLCGRRPCSLLLQYSHRQTRTYPRGELEQDQRDIIITDLASTCTCMPRTMCISLKQGRGFQLVNVRSTTVLQLPRRTLLVVYSVVYYGEFAHVFWCCVQKKCSKVICIIDQ